MTRPSSAPDAKRRRANPDWGRPPQPLRWLPTEFEIEVKRLGLRKGEYVTSLELKLWCGRNRNRCFIPEWLLEAWNMEVEATFSGAA